MSYFDWLRLQTIKEEPEQQPLPEPIVDVARLCSEIETSIAATHQKAIHNFDCKLFAETVHNHQPMVDVVSFCKDIQEHTRLSHDWFLTCLDYCGGGHHLQRNGWKMREKIYTRRLKARQWYDAKLTKERAKAEAAVTRKVKTKPRATPRTKVTFSPRKTVIELLPEPTASTASKRR